MATVDTGLKKPSFPNTQEKLLTLESIPELILLMVQPGSSITLRSGALAKAVGLSPDTIRHYERMGVLPRAARTSCGYRVYPASAVERVQLAHRALRIGFTLSELAEFLKARDAGGAPCHRVYDLAQEKLKQLSMNIQALRQTERYLKKVLSDWEQRLQQATPGQKCQLLQTLHNEPMMAGTLNQVFRRKRV